MDFTGLSVLALLFGSSFYLDLEGSALFDRGCLETPGDASESPNSS